MTLASGLAGCYLQTSSLSIIHFCDCLLKKNEGFHCVSVSDAVLAVRRYYQFVYGTLLVSNVHRLKISSVFHHGDPGKEYDFVRARFITVNDSAYSPGKQTDLTAVECS